MRAADLLSGQLLAWSVTLDTQVHCRSARAPREASQAAPTLTPHSARFTHRALQALRQPRLPLRAGAWPRSEVLSFRELLRTAAADGLRSGGVPRTGQYRIVELSACPRDPGSDLRDQPGTPASSRDTLRDCGERDRTAHHPPSGPRRTRDLCGPGGACLLGYSVRRHTDRQHAGRVDRCRGLVPQRQGERS